MAATTSARRLWANFAARLADRPAAVGLVVGAALGLDLRHDLLQEVAETPKSQG